MSKLNFLEKFRWFQKLKKVKHIEIILVVVLASLVLLIWFVDFDRDSDKSENAYTSGISSTTAYAQELENRLKIALSSISGAGRVTVMITLDGTVEKILAMTSDSKTSTTSNTTTGGSTNTTSTTTTSSEPVIIKDGGISNPIVLSEIMPDIKGVIVVAEGADNVRVKLDLLKAVQALLNVKSSQIEIFSGK